MSYELRRRENLDSCIRNYELRIAKKRNLDSCLRRNEHGIAYGDKDF